MPCFKRINNNTMANNNEAFFEKLEQLIREHGVTIDRPKGTAHPRFPDRIYPINYGYINDTQSQDGDGIDVFLGDDKAAGVVGIICTVDIVKLDSEVKVLYKCDEDNIQTALKLMTNDPMRGVLVRRHN
jgi:inorganic pyrophosphatase